MGSGTLKPGWTRVAFGDVAVCVNDRIDKPVDAGVERYVGLEHLDSDSLVIRRWGSPAAVTATKLLFRKGDIIFGRRRVYQRKLAVADFDGICSAHALVLRAKSGAVLPQFLPFFMQSDVFMERAKAISVGSLSPTINWRTLASEEFALPPLDEQRRIAEAATSAGALSLAQSTLTKINLHRWPVCCQRGLCNWVRCRFSSATWNWEATLIVAKSRLPVTSPVLDDWAAAESCFRHRLWRGCDRPRVWPGRRSGRAAGKSRKAGRRQVAYDARARGDPVSNRGSLASWPPWKGWWIR